MQQPNKAYRVARKNQKRVERHHRLLRAFWIANIIIGLAVLAYSWLNR